MKRVSMLKNKISRQGGGIQPPSPPLPGLLGLILNSLDNLCRDVCVLCLFSLKDGAGSSVKGGEEGVEILACADKAVRVVVGVHNDKRRGARNI